MDFLQISVKLLGRLAKQEAETAKLRAAIEAMADDRPKANNPHVFAPEKDELFGVAIHKIEDGVVVADIGCRNINGKVKHALRVGQPAEDWADMLNVMLELRVCEGACELRVADTYTLVPSTDRKEVITAALWWKDPETAALAGNFDSEHNAKKAIETVGEERILKAFRTAAGVVGG